MNEITERRESEVTIYDPDKGLQTIAVAEAGEKHWLRAKDAKQLCKAIETKLTEQAKYVVWRDSVVVPSKTTGGPGRGKKGAVAPRVVLPESDPGQDVVDSWRKRFCTKKEGVTVIDDEKLSKVLDDMQSRAVRLCETGSVSTVRGTEGTGEFERYTPAKYIEGARLVLGGIDLDPAS